jgi:hypothetical protein
MSLSWSSSFSALAGRNRILVLLGIRDRLLRATDRPILANAALSVGQSYKNFYVVEGLAVVIKTRTVSRLLKRRHDFQEASLHNCSTSPSAKTAFGRMPAFVEAMKCNSPSFSHTDPNQRAPLIFSPFLRSQENDAKVS